MNDRSVLRHEDNDEYLIHCYFRATLGEDGHDYVGACIGRAYLDMCRNLRGVGSVEDAEGLSAQAHGLLRARIEDIRRGWDTLSGETAFDAWHHGLCATLIGLYVDHGYGRMCLGLAQQWINMALRYAFVLGDQRVSRLGSAYPLCHAPLDTPLVERLETDFGFPPLSASCVRLTDYGEYLDYQWRLRDAFTLVPLDIDLLLSLSRPEDIERVV